MNRILYISLAIFVLCSCSRNDYKYYSGESRIQFLDIEDSVKTKTFYYDAPEIIQDTIWFTLQTTGYPENIDRPFKIAQFTVSDMNNAEEGLHYKVLSELEESYFIPANSTQVKIPVILYRENLAPQTAYYLNIEILENEFFKQGENIRLWRRVVFSKDLLKPKSWTDWFSQYMLGEYSINKHRWMIEQTGQLWDEDFIGGLFDEPGSTNYWRDKLNEYLQAYNAVNPPLTDDDGIEITGFPK